MKSRELNVIVGVDMSKMDDALIKYIHVARGYYPFAHFTLLHNIKMNELPADLKTPEMLEEIREQIRRRLKEIVSESGIEDHFSIEVTTDNFSELAFLRIGKKQRANLVILGNKQNLSGSGGLSHKLIRMWQVATLLVPETYRARPTKIIRGIDFSKYTEVVNRVARYIISRNQFGIEHVEPVNVAKVNWQFFPGPAEGDLKKFVREYSETRQKKWKKEFPSEEPLKILPTTDQSIATVLSDYIEETQTDLAIMGVLGASSLTGLFMGSVTNELINLPTSSGILLIKRPVADDE